MTVTKLALALGLILGATSVGLAQDYYPPTAPYGGMPYGGMYAAPGYYFGPGYYDYYASPYFPFVPGDQRPVVRQPSPRQGIESQR